MLSFKKSILAKLDELSLLMRFHSMGNEKILEFIYYDKKIKFFLPYAQKDFIQRKILKTQTFYEIDALEKFRNLIPPQAIIIDAGVNIGNHSVFFSTICDAKKIYAFEPMLQNFEVLKKNVKLNNGNCIECINAALGSVNGRANILTHRSINLGATRVSFEAKGNYEVKTIDELDLKQLNILKIDVEGSQSNVLEGAKKTLQRCSPLIWIEWDEKSKRTLEVLNYVKRLEVSKTNFIYQKMN
jgi:hypothetical protein